MRWEQLKNLDSTDLAVWAESQPWCRSMSECIQDVKWHSEGDVWTHTKLVLEELRRLPEWNNLTENQQIVLRFAGLFHDVGKPFTTEINLETGRVSSPKHAVKGEFIARNILRELGCEFDLREEICHLVRFHGRPVFLMDRENPNHEVVKLSWVLNNRLLYLFALADCRGRDTDSGRSEENLEFWKLVSEEMGCFENPYPFKTDHARFVFFRASEPDLYYIPYDSENCVVTMMSGLPGSGKDTWLAKHRAKLPVISLDDIREEFDTKPTSNQGFIVQTAQDRCRALLRSKTSFAFNATNTTKQNRTRWINLFADYGAKIEIVYLEPSLQDVLKQNKQREQAVPESVIHKLAEKCEPPTWAECHTLVLPR